MAKQNRIEDAADQISRNPRSTVYGVKDLLGRTWTDPELQSVTKALPYNIEENGSPMILVNVYSEERPVSPNEVYTHLF